MSDIITMDVKMLKVCAEGQVYGAPAAEKGEVLEVPFDVGARLVASGFAELVTEEAEE